MRELPGERETAAGGADLAKGRASSFAPIVFEGPRNRRTSALLAADPDVFVVPPSAPEQDLPQWNEQLS
jgi:hypothetical protein